MMTGPIRVLLVDDDPLVLSGLKMMLGGAGQVQVVGEARNGHEVLPAADLHHPDVVLMDIRMPLLDGIAATRLLRAQPNPPQVIVLTTFDADELVLRALQAGAAGFLLKDSRPPTSSPRSRPCTLATGRCRPRSPAALSPWSPGTPVRQPGRIRPGVGSPRSPRASTRWQPPSPKGTPTPTSPPSCT